MKFDLTLTAAILMITASLLSAPASARADTYQIFDLGVANSHNIYGIDGAGTVVVSNSVCPVGASDPCYRTYLNGVSTSGLLLAAPSLVYDNGSPCTPSLPAGSTVFNGACNNGRVVFGALFSSPMVQGVFIGTDPVADFFHSGTADKIALNASGDFAWTDGLDEELFAAEDLTTDSQVPEPNSMLLLGTGVLAAAGVLRRRFAR